MLHLCTPCFNSAQYDYIFRLQNKNNLLSPYAATYFSPSRIRLKNFSEFFQDSVTRIMSMRVIDSLEVVQVCQDHQKGKAISGRTAQLPGRPLFNRPPVRQSGERIGESKFFQ